MVLSLGRSLADIERSTSGLAAAGAGCISMRRLTDVLLVMAMMISTSIVAARVLVG